MVGTSITPPLLKPQPSQPVTHSIKPKTCISKVTAIKIVDAVFMRQLETTNESRLKLMSCHKFKWFQSESFRGEKSKLARIILQILSRAAFNERPLYRMFSLTWFLNDFFMSKWKVNWMINRQFKFISFIKRCSLHSDEVISHLHLFGFQSNEITKYLWVQTSESEIN